MKSRTVFSSLPSLRIVLFCTLALFVLAGCSPVQPSGGSTGKAITLTATTFDTIDAKFLTDLGNLFHKKYPNVTVRVTQIPEDQYVTKTDTSLLANNPPDIAYLYVPRWMKAKRFLPLNETFASHHIDLSTFNQGILNNVCTYEGKLYCMGGYSGAVVLFYNKKFFREAGIPYPSTTRPMTFDEYAKLAQQLARPNKDIKKARWGGDAGAPYWYIDPDTLVDQEGRKASVTNPAFVHTFDLLTGMVRKGVAPNDSNLAALGASEGASSLFSQQQLAMVIIDNIAIQTFDKQKVEYGIAPTPIQPGQQPWVSSWTNTYGVTTQSKHPTEAKNFIAMLATEGQRLQSQLSYLPLDSAAATKYNWAGNSEPRKQLMEVLQLTRRGVFQPDYFSWVSSLDDVFNTVVHGSATSQQALKAAEPKLQQSLDTTWRIWDAIK
jgi:multiple sugar transport system substrate-binding protein